MRTEVVASNEVVHFISQLVISAWIHSSASDKQPTASPELRSSHTSCRTQTHTQGGEEMALHELLGDSVAFAENVR